MYTFYLEVKLTVNRTEILVIIHLLWQPVNSFKTPGETFLNLYFLI